MLPRRKLTGFVLLAVLACDQWAHESTAAAFYPGPALDPTTLETFDPATPLPLGQVPPTATNAQRDALYWVNTHRAHAGLDPIDLSEALNAAADAHADYMIDHPSLYSSGGLNAHEQLPGHAGFLGRHYWQRMEAAGYDGAALSEVITYWGNPAVAVARWMDTVYHRLPLLHPSARHLGYATRAHGQGRVDVLDLGEGAGPDWHVVDGILWPPDGAQNVPTVWQGNERPKPPTPATGFPSGPVITLTFGAGQPPTLTSHRLEAVDSGVSIPHTIATPATDTKMTQFGAIALYADDPLAPSTTYRVMLEGTAHGRAFAREATFTTRPSACTQDAHCGPGRHCEPTAGACRWLTHQAL